MPRILINSTASMGRVIPAKDFLNRIPREDQIALATLGQSNPALQVFMWNAVAATTINLDAEEAIEGVEAISAALGWTEAQKAALLA